MFAYLLITAELLILSAAFYYVFVREPRPFEIKENIWGCYDQAVDTSTGYGVSASESFTSTTTTTNGAPKRSRKMRKAIYTGHVLLRSARHGVKAKMATASAIKQGWVESNESKPAKPLASVLAFLGEALTRLSVKIS
jgi:hypothetical protein